MNRLKACVFDAFGTLFKVSIPSDELDIYINGQGDALLEIWRRKQLEYTWLRTLMGNWADFDQVTTDALKYAAQSLGLTHFEELEKLLMPIYHRPDCFDDVPATLQNLKAQQITTAILSNGTPEMLQAGIEKTGLTKLVDHVFSASLIQQFKIAPPVYQMVLDELNLQASEVLFFSSNAWDVAGAKQFGFQTVWVNRNRGIFEELGVKPDWEIGDLLEWEMS